MEGKELLEAFAQTKKPLSVVLEFMREGDGEGDGVKDSESEVKKAGSSHKRRDAYIVG